MTRPRLSRAVSVEALSLALIAGLGPLAQGCGGAIGASSAPDDEEARRSAACAATGQVIGSSPPAEAGAKEESCPPLDQLGADDFDGTLTERCMGQLERSLEAAPRGVDRAGIAAVVDEAPPVFVSEIAIRGARAVPEPLIRAVIRSSAGELLEGRRLAADVRRVYGLEAFEDVQVVTEPVDEGVRLVFVVAERPLIGRVYFEGGEAPPWRTTLLAGDVYQPSRVRRELERLTTRDLGLGHLLAAGEVRVHPVEAGLVDLCFRLQPGRRFTIGTLDFTGNHELDDEALRRGLRTSDGAVNVPDGLYREDLLLADLEALELEYYNRGMVNARLGPPRADLEGGAGRVRVTVPVIEGEVFTFGALSVSGAIDAEDAEAEEILGLAAGEVFSRARVFEALSRVAERARQLGQGEVTVTPISSIDAGRRSIELRFEVTPL